MILTRAAIENLAERLRTRLVRRDIRAGVLGVAGIVVVGAGLASGFGRGAPTPTVPVPAAPSATAIVATPTVPPAPTAPSIPTAEPTALPTVADTPTPTPGLSAVDDLASDAIARLDRADRLDFFPTPIPSARAATGNATAGGSAGPPPVARPGAPVRLIIPKIGVNAAIESVDLDPTGAMATPTTAFTVGWYDRGPLPGDAGNAVIDGHLDSAIYGAAVFWRLSEVQAGDKIQVQLPGNRNLTFVVDHLAVYPYDNAPLEDIFGAADAPRLNLITCSGLFDRASKNYDRRLVVYSRLVS
jgi:sortase (surface protein transpeptidase)